MGYEYTNFSCFIGCTQKLISPGCRNCLARTDTSKLSGLQHPSYQRYGRVIDRNPLRWNGIIDYCPERLKKDLATKRPTKFLTYMGEIARAEQNIIKEIIYAMSLSPQHQLTMLTKLPRELRRKITRALKELNIPFPTNIILAVSVENKNYICRIRELQRMPWGEKEVWFKPLLGPIGKDYSLEGIDTVRINGEGGRHPREYKEEWADEIRTKAEEYSVQVIFGA